MGDLEEGGLLGQLLDGVAAVAEVAGGAVELADGALGAGGAAEGGVVEPDVGEEPGPLTGVDGAVHDGDVDAVAGPVVDDGDAGAHGQGPRVAQG